MARRSGRSQQSMGAAETEPAVPAAAAPKRTDSPRVVVAPVPTPGPECVHSWLRGRDEHNRQHYFCERCGKVIPR